MVEQAPRAEALPGAEQELAAALRLGAVVALGPPAEQGLVAAAARRLLEPADSQAQGVTRPCPYKRAAQGLGQVTQLMQCASHDLQPLP